MTIRDHYLEALDSAFLQLRQEFAKQDLDAVGVSYVETPPELLAHIGDKPLLVLTAAGPKARHIFEVVKILCADSTLGCCKVQDFVTGRKEA